MTVLHFLRPPAEPSSACRCAELLIRLDDLQLTDGCSGPQLGCLRRRKLESAARTRQTIRWLNISAIV